VANMLLLLELTVLEPLADPTLAKDLRPAARLLLAAVGDPNPFLASLSPLLAPIGLPKPPLSPPDRAELAAEPDWLPVSPSRDDRGPPPVAPDPVNRVELLAPPLLLLLLFVAWVRGIEACGLSDGNAPPLANEVAGAHRLFNTSCRTVAAAK
jgi:hypothetical protein